MHMKQVKNTDELIDYLITKGIKIYDVALAKESINDYTYYGIVNTYKSVFKNADETYKKGVSFEEIFALFQFDMNLKALFIKYILEIELVLKSKIANLFTEKYGLKDYLVPSNFASNNANNQAIALLIERIENDIDTSYLRHDAITHFKDEYGYIPPFVLVKIISFGVMSRFYGLMQLDDQQNISKSFGISAKTLKAMLKNLTFVRNICAHSDRLFCYHSINTISVKSLKINYTLPNNTNNLYIIILTMEKLLKKDKYLDFKKELDLEIYKLSNELKSISIKDILKIMGIKN